jgi:hypothetical protein
MDFFKKINVVQFFIFADFIAGSGMSEEVCQNRIFK